MRDKRLEIAVGDADQFIARPALGRGKRPRHFRIVDQLGDVAERRRRAAHAALGGEQMLGLDDLAVRPPSAALARKAGVSFMHHRGVDADLPPVLPDRRRSSAGAAGAP